MAGITVQEADRVLSHEPLNDDEKRFLLTCANNTLKSIEVMTSPSGLPVDTMSVETGKVFDYTSPTNIADAGLLATLAAFKTGLIPTKEMEIERLDTILTSLDELPKLEGEFVDTEGKNRKYALPYNWYEADTGVVIPGYTDKGDRRTSVSSVDTARLAAVLWITGLTVPEVRNKSDRILEGLDLGFFYNPENQLMHGEYVEETGFEDWYYGLFCTDGRIPMEIAIARDQIPGEAFFAMRRTVPEEWHPRNLPDEETTQIYLLPDGKLISVVEGFTRDDLGQHIVPSWNGTGFEAFSPLIYYPEDSWSIPWNRNLRRHLEAQIRSGDYIWGESSCLNPDYVYRENNAECLGASEESSRLKHPERFLPDKVITPHASFLTLPLNPKAVIRNARKLQEGGIFGELGFPDSVSASGSKKTPYILSGAQGMILASITDQLTDGTIRSQLNPYMWKVRQLMAMEKFSV